MYQKNKNMKGRPQSWKQKHKPVEEKYPMVVCPSCKQKHKQRRCGTYCNMTCWYRGNRIETE